MRYFDFMDSFGYPEDAWQRALGKEAKRTSFYVYEIHCMHHNFWENAVWIFDHPNEFRDFAYALVMFEKLFDSEDTETDFEEIEIDNDVVKTVQSMRSHDWTFENCVEFVHKFSEAGIELKQIGWISDLIEFPSEKFELCKQYIDDEEELQKLNLKEGEYKILNDYSSKFGEHPSQNENQFLEFLSNFGS